MCAAIGMLSFSRLFDATKSTCPHHMGRTPTVNAHSAADCAGGNPNWITQSILPQDYNILYHSTSCHHSAAADQNQTAFRRACHQSSPIIRSRLVQVSCTCFFIYTRMPYRKENLICTTLINISVWHEICEELVSLRKILVESDKLQYLKFTVYLVAPQISIWYEPQISEINFWKQD